MVTRKNSSHGIKAFLVGMVFCVITTGVMPCDAGVGTHYRDACSLMAHFSDSDDSCNDLRSLLKSPLDFAQVIGYEKLINSYVPLVGSGCSPALLVPPVAKLLGDYLPRRDKSILSFSNTLILLMYVVRHDRSYSQMLAKYIKTAGAVYLQEMFEMALWDISEKVYQEIVTNYETLITLGIVVLDEAIFDQYRLGLDRHFIFIEALRTMKNTSGR